MNNFKQHLTVKSEYQPTGLVTDSIANLPQEISDKYRSGKPKC